MPEQNSVQNCSISGPWEQEQAKLLLVNPEGSA
jgi:hypothetical protein